MTMRESCSGKASQQIEIHLLDLLSFYTISFLAVKIFSMINFIDSTK